MAALAGEKSFMAQSELDDLDDSLACGGGSIPSGGGPAYRLWLAEKAPIPILVAAPHSGRAYPPEVLAAMREADYARLRLEDRHVDLLARAAAAATGAGLLLAEAPRAVLDLNRAPDDIDWDMVAGGAPLRVRHSLANRRARSGLGLIPRRLSGMGEIWRSRLSADALAERIEGIHRPYHAALQQALAAICDQWGAVLLIDLHSMPPLRSVQPGERTAEFVIGDRFGASCDPLIAARALRHLTAAGRIAAHNRPYSGGYVLERHAAPRRRIHALQLEVCRGSYLDARLAEPSARLPGVARLLAGLIRTLAADVAALGGADQHAQAAE